MGRHKTYRSAKALEEAVDAYFASISYPEPVLVTTPTGELDDQGRPKFAHRMLTDKLDGTGKPVTVTRYMTPPSMAGLCRALKISKQTWSKYGGDEKLGPVVEDARGRMEAYWVSLLPGKGAQGAKFALTCCYGWTEKLELTHRGQSLEDFLHEREEAAP